MSERSYHHGALRPALIEAALEVLAESGPLKISMREVARRAGVSHAASAHHFGDKRGLITAIAVQGFTLLAEELERARTASEAFADLGVAYVSFAVSHPAHFSVMFRPELQHREDPELIKTSARAFEELTSGVAALGPAAVGSSPEVAAVAAWSLVHGFSSLWLDGALPTPAATPPGTPDELARRVAALLFTPSGGPGSEGG